MARTTRQPSIEAKFRRNQQKKAVEEYSNLLKNPGQGSPDAQNDLGKEIGPIQDRAADFVMPGSDAEIAKQFALYLENPEAAQWLEEFVARVSTGKISEAGYSSLDHALQLLKEAPVSRTTQLNVGTFIGDFSKIEYNSRQGVPIDKIAQNFDVTKNQVAQFLAFVTLWSNKRSRDVVMTAKHSEYKEFYNFDPNELERFAAVSPLADEQSYVAMAEDLWSKVGRTFAKHMDAAHIVRFVSATLTPSSEWATFDKKMLAESLRGEKQKILDAFKEQVASGMFGEAFKTLKCYGALFGEMPKDTLASQISALRIISEIGTDGALNTPLIEIKKAFAIPTTPALKEYKEASAQFGVKVRVVSEQKLLDLKAKSDKKSEVSRFIFAPTVKPKELSAAATTSTELDRPTAGTIEKSSGQQEEEVVIFEPLKKNEAEYLGPLEQGLQKMRETTEMRDRTSIFLGQVWPQLLLARANGSATPSIERQTREALQLLPGPVKDDFLELITLGADPAKNKEALNAVAARLRKNRELHAQGAYVWAEVLPRTKKTAGGEERVSILSTQSYKLEGARTMEITGGETRILLAGQRIDKIDQELSALGINVRGDGEGVVFLEQIKEAIHQDVLPFLTDQTQIVVEKGKQIHPLLALQQQALRADHGYEYQCDRAQVLKRAVWSTTAHEVRHEDDRRKKYAEKKGGNHAVEMEVTAYLTSIAMPSEEGGPSQPFTDLLKVINLYRGYREGLARLGDMFGVYEQASEKILTLLAAKLGVERVTPETLQQNHLDLSAEILRAALTADRTGLQEIAQSILDDLYAEYPVAEKPPTHRAKILNPGRNIFTRELPEMPKPEAVPVPKDVAPAAEPLYLPAASSVKLDMGSKRTAPKTLLTRLRENVWAVGLAAAVGLFAADKASSKIEKDIHFADAPTDVQRKKTAVDIPPDQTATAERAAKAEEQSRKEYQALLSKGLWGFVETYIAGQGVKKEDVVKYRTYAYPPGKNYADLTSEEKQKVYSGYIEYFVAMAGQALSKQPGFGIKNYEDVLRESDYGVRYKKTKQWYVDLEKWEETITPQKAAEIQIFLNTHAKDWADSESEKISSQNG